MKLFCFLFGVFTTACAPHAKQFSVDPAFAPYVTLFYAEAAKRGISPQHEDLIVRYDERESLRDSNLMGECNTNYNESPTVLISRYRWDYKLGDTPPAEDEWHVNYREYNKRFLIFHELGHCLLGRSHNPALTVEIDVNTDLHHYVRSIMAPAAGILSVDFYVAHWDEYVAELFRLSPGPI